MNSILNIEASVANELCKDSNCYFLVEDGVIKSFEEEKT